MKPYPTAVLRTVALHSQGLDKAEDTPSTREILYQTIEQVGCIQIDTLHMVRRSQYLVLWSRLGSYDPAEFDKLVSPVDRRLFEGWEHAASLIPLTEYRYQLPHQRNLREHPTNWYNRWLNETVQKEFVPQVLERVRREGALESQQLRIGRSPGGYVVELATGQSSIGIPVCLWRIDDFRQG